MKRILFTATGLILLAIGTVFPLYAGNIPETPIGRILNYKTGLELTDSQIKKLGILDNTIKEKMIQIKAQAEIRRQEINRFTSNWASMNSAACSRLVKEYYGLLADLKVLELDAIMKARSVLTPEQLRKYEELADIESMIFDLEQKASLSF